MNTSLRSVKTALLAAACLTFFSAYTPQAHFVKSKDEYSAVLDFIYDNICIPLENGVKEEPAKNISVKVFSRCPSGYDPNILSKTDSVTTDRFVNGKIVYYKGCNPYYVCNFKVCVNRNFVMLRSGSKEYVSVNTWIQRRNAKTEKVVVKG